MPIYPRQRGRNSIFIGDWSQQVEPHWLEVLRGGGMENIGELKERKSSDVLCCAKDFIWTINRGATSELSFDAAAHCFTVKFPLGVVIIFRIQQLFIQKMSFINPQCTTWSPPNSKQHMVREELVNVEEPETKPQPKEESNYLHRVEECWAMWEAGVKKK